MKRCSLCKAPIKHSSTSTLCAKHEESLTASVNGVPSPRKIVPTVAAPMFDEDEDGLDAELDAPSASDDEEFDAVEPPTANISPTEEAARLADVRTQVAESGVPVVTAKQGAKRTADPVLGARASEAHARSPVRAAKIIKRCLALLGKMPPEFWVGVQGATGTIGMLERLLDKLAETPKPKRGMVVGGIVVLKPKYAEAFEASGELKIVSIGAKGALTCVDMAGTKMLLRSTMVTAVGT